MANSDETYVLRIGLAFFPRKLQPENLLSTILVLH